jgi:hypothetical protein
MYRPIETYIKDFVEYSADAPTGLVWAKDIIRGKGSIFKRKGDVAGNLIERHGYYFVQICNVKYRCHRLVYWLITGEDVEVVDHLDGNPLNNKIENLRGCNREINNRNTKQRKDVKTGFQGVSFRTIKGVDFYVACYSENNKRKQKAFHCKI